MYVISQDKIQRLVSLTGKASRIAIVTHTRPDGDAIGSSVALMHFLSDVLGKECSMAIATPCPDALRFVFGPDDGPDKVFLHKERPDETARMIAGCDLLFCLDCSSVSRTGDMQAAVEASPAVKILIDHHLTPETGPFELVFSETEISSTCELLYYILTELPEVNGDCSRLPESTLRALMTGMTTDTNNFANSVFPGTLAMASALLAAGVDRDEILQHLFNEYRENRIRLLGFLLFEKLRIRSNGVAYMILDKKTKERFDVQEAETEGFVNIPLAVKEIKFSLFVTEEDDKFRVSIRSKHGYSANRMAGEHFHGGGHEQAAGGKILAGEDIADHGEVEAYILKATENY